MCKGGSLSFDEQLFQTDEDRLLALSTFSGTSANSQCEFIPAERHSVKFKSSVYCFCNVSFKSKKLLLRRCISLLLLIRLKSSLYVKYGKSVLLQFYRIGFIAACALVTWFTSCCASSVQCVAAGTSSALYDSLKS